MGYNIPISKGEIPFITTKQMIEVDRLMIEKYNINLVQMMENAGRCLAIVVRDAIILNDGSKVLIIAGAGGNGGGGMTSARRLYNWGYDVNVLITSDRNKYQGTIKSQLRILENIGVSIVEQKDFAFEQHYDVIVDAMIGYSLKGELRKNAIRIVNWVNQSKSFVVSLDVPSGIDSTTGELRPVCVNANTTITLALPKIGFRKRESEIGRLLLADISVPTGLYEQGLGIKVDSIFSKSDIVELR